ncbi:cytochrome P450 [Actinomadura sp. KC216]|uniref:cytochrome P450 n=1 Tax=Actinomadura sp. KC216 TaxID=2530370 RepID=UPI001047A503|nr:cytochrome P450 [Actinomadura sp. KC216]TDB89408.1 cytochrome P450 [Actinomadura sp. KC216]
MRSLDERTTPLMHAPPDPGYDPFARGMVDDPYGFFALARETAPVFYSELIGHWVVTGRDDILSILMAPEVYSASNAIQPITEVGEGARRVLEEGGWGLIPVLGNNDRPDHTRFRRSVGRVFTARRVAGLEPFIAANTHAALDELRPGDDLVGAFLEDLPARVILHLLGVPQDALAMVRKGSDNQVRFIWGRLTASEQEELATAMVRFWTYLRAFVDDRLAAPRDDLTSALLAVRDGDDGVFTLDEVCSVLFAFLNAGHKTTSSLLTNGVRRLLEHPGSWRALHDDPELIDGAVEEILRFDSSVVAWRRRALRDVTVGGIDISAGAPLLLLLGAANHDPATFDAPETFDIRRKNASDHLSFGHGIHFCLGAPLARLEARTVLKILTQRLPDARLVDPQRFEFVPNIAFRAPQGLLIEW